MNQESTMRGDKMNAKESKYTQEGGSVSMRRARVVPYTVCSTAVPDCVHGA